MDLDLQLGLFAKQIGISDGQEAYLVQRVGSIRDQFSQENFFLCVERVDDDIHESRSEGGVPADLSHKGNSLYLALRSELVAQDEDDEENAQEASLDIHYLILYV